MIAARGAAAAATRAWCALAVAACASRRAPPPVSAAVPSEPPAELVEALLDADPLARVGAIAALRRLGFSPSGSRLDGFADVGALDPTVLVDMVFYTGENLLRRDFYGINACFAREELARAIAAASETLRAQGYRLVVRDCYRPRSVQEALLQAPAYDGLVTRVDRANHPRGAAVDVKLAGPDGARLRMTPPGVPFRTVMASDAVVPEPYLGLRRALRDAMIGAGLRPIPNEWWHFDLPEPGRFDQLDVPVAALARWVPATAPAPPREGEPEIVGGM